MYPSIKKSKAMTLVETLFCAVIFTMIMGACVALLLRGWDSWNTSNAEVQLTQGLYQGAAWLSNDLRQSGTAEMINVPADNNPYTQITFSVVQNVLSGGTITWNPLPVNYALGGTSGRQLVRTQNNQTQIIANNITSLQFSRSTANPSLVNVLMTSSVPTYRGNQQLTSTLNFKVLLRNA